MKNIFVENAEKIGQAVAELVSSNNLPLTPEQIQALAEKYQVRIVIVSEGDQLSNPKVRAIYDHHMKMIVVEESSLISLKYACEVSGLGPVGRSDILAIHIAHELFHHLEEIGKVPLSSYYNCGNTNTNGKFFNVSNSVSRSRHNGCPPLLALREAAAHSFVKTLLGLSISPEWIGRQE